MVAYGVYCKNKGATLAPLGKFFIDVIGHAHFFTYRLIMTYLVLDRQPRDIGLDKLGTNISVYGYFFMSLGMSRNASLPRIPRWA